MPNFGDFSLKELYAALDAQRQARGLSWSEATRQINRQSGHRATRSLSSSTVKAIGSRRVAEADGVLQMLLWLNRTPESFIPGYQQEDEIRTRLPVVPADKVLRFDTKKLFAALQTQRTERKVSWTQVATELGLSVSSLTHLASGGRTGFPDVMRMTRWLGVPAAVFTRAANW